MELSNGKITLRPATEQDLSQLNDIYNRYVLETHFTFDVEPMTLEARHEWFTHYNGTGRHRLVVGLSDGALAGYACSSRWRPKPAYETSVETSVYVAPDAVGRGIGTRLYEELFKQLQGEDVHRAYAGIALPNLASIALHERFGFKRVGHFTEQGRKFDRFWDVSWYEKALGGS